MSDMENKKAEVIALYPGPGWRRRVLNMSDGQVFVIWKKNRDKIEAEAKQQKPDPPKQDQIPF